MISIFLVALLAAIAANSAAVVLARKGATLLHKWALISGLTGLVSLPLVVFVAPVVTIAGIAGGASPGLSFFSVLAPVAAAVATLGSAALATAIWVRGTPART